MFFLPIIDLDPTNTSCIYSTLLFVIEHAKKMKIPTASITFDQPLWLKATGIIKEKNLTEIVCRLGGFHTLMSFLGSIGFAMDGSGIQELFEESYASNTVVHMLSGKAYSRSLRGHILAQSSLYSIVLDSLVKENKVDLSFVSDAYSKVTEEDLGEEEFLELCQTENFQNLIKEVNTLLEKKKSESRTAALWVQYIDFVEIVKYFIFAERTSNWSLHIDATKRMLNLFAATGHLHYAKIARVYIQEMEKLPETHPWLHDQFLNDSHTVNRTARNWSGLWTDLTIEQTLMRSLKSRGGLTSGRGLSEPVRHLWTMSLNVCSAIHYAMTTLSKTAFTSSEQYIELGTARRSKDYVDFNKFKDWLLKRNTFVYNDDLLRSLSTGIFVKSSDEVNCDMAEQIGRKIHRSIDNVKLTDAKIKKNDKLKPLAYLTNAVKVGGKSSICVNPTILFTRLAAIAQREDDVEAVFDFELTTFPLSLFKDGLMRKPDKASLRNCLLPPKKQIQLNFTNGVYVIDGGALLHRVHWVKDIPFDEIAEAYVRYTTKNYNSGYIVFDGYEPSTKSNEHHRRVIARSSANVEVKSENHVPYSKDHFLANTCNKKELIEFLKDRLSDAGYFVINCNADADTKIVSTALTAAKEHPTTVVADDTDIAVMLLYHWEDKMSPIYFLQERGKKCWSIKNLQCEIASIKPYLLFIHAWSGCDTTSALFGKGKPSFLKLVSKSKQLQKASDVMNDFWATREEVSESAMLTFASIYGNEKKDLTRIRLV